MEQIITVIGMLMAFLLGAYIREPYVKRRPQTTAPKVKRKTKPVEVEKEAVEKIDDVIIQREPVVYPKPEKSVLEKMMDDIASKTDEFELKQASQFAELMRFTGKPDKYADMRQEEETDED